MPLLKIYLDNCCYNRPFDSQEQMKIHLETEAKLFIQSEIKNNRYTLAWSYMLDYENNCNPYEEKRNAVAIWKNIAQDYCPSSNNILLKGQFFMKYGIKAKDALHIACAVNCGCDYFITTDRKLLNKKLTDIIISSPIDFIVNTEDF